MGTSDRTKLLLAEQLKRMSRGVPFGKLRVAELCARCGIDRRTFYYHFRDIYDLAAWIFSHTLEECLSQAASQPGQTKLTLLLRRLEEDAAFYRCALEDYSQNALGEYIIGQSIALYERLLKKARRVEQLSEEDLFAISYHCRGSVAMIRLWLLADRRNPPEAMAQSILAVMPQAVRTIYPPERRKE